MTAPLLGEVVARWVRDGTAEQIAQRRVTACRERSVLAREVLVDLQGYGDTASPHLWIELPGPWSAGSFVAAARDQGILVAPGDDYLADRTRPAHGIRLGLNAHGIRLGLNAEVPDDKLRDALTTLLHLVRLGPTAS